MNILLKYIFTVLTIAIVVITNNRIILWLFLLLLTFYNLYKDKKILLIFDLILVILLGLSKESEMCLIGFKVLYIFNYILTICNSIDKESFIGIRKSTKIDYFENNFDKVVERINEKKQELYDEDVSIDNRIERDLDRSYLQAKIRYYNYTSKKKWYNWNRIDTLVLMIILIVFVLLFILR